MRNRSKIPYNHYRVVLTDVMPYELPLIFSNKYFFEFLNHADIKLVLKSKGKFEISSNDTSDKMREIIRLLFGYSAAAGSKNWIRSIPFDFKVNHKENDFRVLSVMHPRNQIMVADFYKSHQHLILYYCGLSPFSLRKPSSIARFVNYKDQTHFHLLAKDEINERVEQDGTEYKSLKSFFVYKKYSNIYKFYESYKFHRCEKKYSNLYKFDIGKCFDSIYSHSIVWSMYSKELIKDCLSESKISFGGEFDKLMQELNRGETNGIIIGPEVSRIFSEIILQKIDTIVEKKLASKGILHKVHYEAFRYIDDYFIFYDNPSQLETILSCFKLELKEFKLFLNDSKHATYSKPIITELTIAKNRISRLLGDSFKFEMEEKERKVIVEDTAVFEKYMSGGISLSANSLITEFKTILSETKVKYKDIINFSLTVIERKVKKILKNYLSCDDKKEKNLANAILEILDFSFFIYSVCPRVNATIKICRILSTLIAFSNKHFTPDMKHIIYKYIFDNVNLVLKKNSNNEYSQVETVYLLVTLGELGRQYWLDTTTLANYFRIQSAGGTFLFPGDLNYFSYICLLFYIKDKKRYVNLKHELEKQIEKKITSPIGGRLYENTEKVFLLFDTLTCPYIEFSVKSDLLLKLNVDVSLHHDIVNYRTVWFTKWTDFSFEKELAAKIGNEVY